MSCWVKGCNGQHDRFMHPRHNCRPPHPRTVKPGTPWRCRKQMGRVTCVKVWQATSHGWELVK